MVGPVTIIGILDKDLIHAKGQDIDKAIAVMLVHRCVHHNRAGQIMGFGQLHQLPGKFLPAAIQMMQIAGAACIDNAACVNPLRSL